MIFLRVVCRLFANHLKHCDNNQIKWITQCGDKLVITASLHCPQTIFHLTTAIIQCCNPHTPLYRANIFSISYRRCVRAPKETSFSEACSTRPPRLVANTHWQIRPHISVWENSIVVFREQTLDKLDVRLANKNPLWLVFW